jgi:ATP-binding cassette, subfamily B, bacterial
MREVGEFLRILMRYLRPYRKHTAALLLLLLVDVAFTAAWPLGFKLIIDEVLGTRNQRLLTIILATLFGGVLLASVASLARDYVYADLSAHVLHDVRLELFVQLQRLSLEFYGRVGIGDLLARFTSDLAAVETAITSAVAALLLNALIIALGAVMLVALEWRLALLTVIGLAACVLSPHGISRRAAAASYEARRSQAGLTETVQENIAAQPLVKAFGLERLSIDRFRIESLGVADVTRRFGFLSYIAERLPNVVILISEIVVVGVGILLVFYGYRPLGTIVAFHAVFLNITASVGGLASVMPVILQSLGGLRRIEEVLGEQPEVADVADAIELPPLSRNIEFRDVTFGYSHARTDLDRVTIEIRKGQFVALVGASGSGKSTTLNLIMRFYDPSSGVVAFDTCDLRRVSQASLRGQMGVVFQDNLLFNISIRDNLRLSDPNATDAAIETAARAAEIHDFVVGLPDGYGTVAGERGARFSGGQRQRLALARALVRNPPILLLDEATSALDPAAEAAINETLRRVAKDRTVVSVTHRLSTIVHADSIILLERGRVRERGRHDELLQRNGLYAQLWRKQGGFSLNENGDEADVDIDRLKTVPILSGLNEEILSDLRNEFLTERHPTNRRVIVQGDPGNRFYIVVRGKVEVVAEQPDGTERRTMLSDGDYFGEVALLIDVPRTANVWTRSPCIFLTLERADFVALLDRAPLLHQSLIQTYLERVVNEHQETNSFR